MKCDYERINILLFWFDQEISLDGLKHLTQLSSSGNMGASAAFYLLFSTSVVFHGISLPISYTNLQTTAKKKERKKESIFYLPLKNISVSICFPGRAHHIKAVKTTVSSSFSRSGMVWLITYITKS